jgi:hypothetical protein
MTPELDLDRLTLSAGRHDPGSAMSVMEAVAYVAGEPWSDHPECASHVIGVFLRTWNDTLDDIDRQMLKPYIPRLVGTAAPPAVERARAWMASDWLIRTFMPAWLRRAGLTGSAAALEGLPEITSTDLIEQALPIMARARQDARVARDAAWGIARDAVGASTWDAVGTSGWSAARAAARSAFWHIAWDVAGETARAAAEVIARDAAWQALARTVTELQQSALSLLDRMIEAQMSVEFDDRTDDDMPPPAVLETVIHVTLGDGWHAEGTSSGTVLLVERTSRRSIEIAFSDWQTLVGFLAEAASAGHPRPAIEQHPAGGPAPAAPARLDVFGVYADAMRAARGLA